MRPAEEIGRRGVFKKNKIVVLLMAALFATTSGPSGATLVSMPKALKSPVDGMAPARPLWGPLAYDFNCITHLDECQGQPKKISLLSLPKVLKPQLDRLSLEARALPPMAHSVFCYEYPKD